MRFSDRLERIPPYLFATLDQKIEERLASGADVISFAVGDPDIPPPEHVKAALVRAVEDDYVHRYPSYKGMPELREATAEYCEHRFGVDLDPSSEVLALIGSKEGIAHLALAMCSQGDVVLVPDPAYPVYEMSALIAGAEIYRVPLSEERGFMPALDSIPDEIADRARLLWLNYPNNPCAAVATLDFFREVVGYAKKHDLLVAHDNAYAEITYDGYIAPSILQVDGAKDVAVEFHSLSKTFSMAGWRVGMVVGNSDAISALGQIKTNIDSGIFPAVQRAAIAALNGPRDFIEKVREVYGHRRKLLVDGLRSIGWDWVQYPEATLYVWAKVPEGYRSGELADLLLDKADVVVVPGAGYGKHGEGFVRFSVTLDEKRVQEGIERIGEAFGGSK
ncbi:MAG: LL-diaminopimelate aminotransferase [Acidimicrobiia bacterium]